MQLNEFLQMNKFMHLPPRRKVEHCQYSRYLHPPSSLKRTPLTPASANGKILEMTNFQYIMGIDIIVISLVVVLHNSKHEYIIMDKAQRNDIDGTWGLTLTLSLISCSAFGKSLTLSDPRFLHM